MQSSLLFPVTRNSSSFCYFEEIKAKEFVSIMEAIGALQASAFPAVSEPLHRCKTIKIAFFELCRKRGLGNSVFLDKGHLNYYSTSGSGAIRCGAKVCGGEGKMEKKMKKKKDKEVKDVKKRLKVLKRLSKDLKMFADSSCGLNSGTDNLSVDHQVEANRISDAMMLLEGQMEQLRLKEKELKLKSKEEKRMLKTAQMQNLDCGMLSSSSSSSSESSDSECDRESSNVLLLSTSDRLDGAAALLLGQLQDLRNREKETATALQVTVPQMDTLFQSHEVFSGEKDIEFGSTSCLEQDCCSQITKSFRQIEGPESWAGKKSLVDGSMTKIEVCMGGKCKKAGAGLLLEEFQRVAGIEAAVSGCKCMSKCRDGPNVRVSASTSQVPGSPRTAANSLCLGVGIEDVSLIVDNLLKESAPALVAAL